MSPIAIFSRAATGCVNYRHPLRTIALIDLDAAYASMEMVRLGLKEDQPLAVHQWGALIAVNYPARAFGVSRQDTVIDARKRCPHIVLVHPKTYREGDEVPEHWDDATRYTHKISLEFYRQESEKVLNVFKEAGGVVEKASIDESFIDLTLPVRSTILREHPSLNLSLLKDTKHECKLDDPLPTPRELGISLDWERAGNVVPLPSTSDVETDRKTKEGGCGEMKGEEEDGKTENEQEGEEVTWHDVALWYGAQVVRERREEVRSRYGYTCSAGVAGNKMLAKLCAGVKKPNGQTLLRSPSIASFLRPRRFQKIRNLGGKHGRIVAEVWKASTVGEVLHVKLSAFQKELGEETGKLVYDLVRGVDLTEVINRTELKSFLTSKLFRPPVEKVEEMNYWITQLAMDLYVRLRDARLDGDIWPKTLMLQYSTLADPTQPQQTTFNSVHGLKSHQIPFPFTNSLSVEYIANSGRRLVKSTLPPSDTPVETLGPWETVLLGFEGLERGEKGQEGIQSFFGGSKRSSSSQEEDKPDVHLVSFNCERCSQAVVVEAGKDVEREEAEHRDWHVARDLLEEERRAMRPGMGLGGKREGGKRSGGERSGVGGGGREKKRAKGQTGLEGFLVRK
ncbi:DNA polymerase eta subunit [Pseudohyphozyma bogoriensis]|nr:DNA polymerase eta subunit [Pseudohyphozyma bogoriensis]